ncbi:hypothetical protein VY88_28995 [Azospirillum thiophilum]|uniref:Uncharacterized protein n=1 Tax=Azospirillum thiophilum TaxID=528244 RepID=A0A0F2KNN6_9PROT|nr:hypothetical protein [Azospirillum thiophilum]ALG75616.1 hypothetical protein AL072_32320 [Azospirillum thiophilum]KJR61959.1 hypothetical protein VY88_27735 [Azospirillum thiophilum]KJR62136.1 hypothetical protein VY88_28995 [Azospirillum thiophilum]
MTPIPQLLRLLLLLLTPFWLSLAADGIGLHGSSLLSNWRRTPAAADTTLAPPSGWRERAYLAANPDVAAAVRNGQVSSGYAHYVQHGRAEGRGGGLAEPAKPEAASAPAPAPLPATPNQDAPVPATKPEPQDGAPAIRTEPAVEAPRPGVKPAPEPPAPAPAPAPAVPARLQAAPSATPRHVERIRTANGGDGVRVVLDLDGAPRFETQGRRPDGRLEVTLPGTLWQAAPSGRLPATTLGYSVERSGAGTRLLFSDEEARGNGRGDDGPLRLLAVSTLAPDKDRGHRLVIDVALPSMAKADRKGR